MGEAIAAAEQRKREREARAARESAEKEARQLAIDARDQAFREKEKLVRQLERVEKDIAAEEAALAGFATERRTAEAEKAFLLDFVTKAQANVNSLQAVLAKLAAPPAPSAATAAR